MKKVGFLLFIISSILKRLLQPVMYLINSVMAIKNGEWDKYNTDLAISIDQLGNGLCRYLFNSWLRNKSSKHGFGNIDETISSVLGKNERDKTLSWLGRRIAGLLNFIQKDHCKMAIDETEN